MSLLLTSLLLIVSLIIWLFMHPQSGRHIELLLSVHPMMISTDDQAGCVDDHKEKIFSCDHFYQSYAGFVQTGKIMENEIFQEKSWNFDFREKVMEKSWKIRKNHAKSCMCNGKTGTSNLADPNI
jgi:hypothetical protein